MIPRSTKSPLNIYVHIYVVVVVVAVAERFIVAECAFSVAEARVGENGLPPFLLLLMVTPPALLLL